MQNVVKDFTFYIYSHEEHVDVVKQYKKKVVAYSLRSKNLQNSDMFVSADLYSDNKVIEF